MPQKVKKLHVLFYEKGFATERKYIENILDTLSEIGKLDLITLYSYIEREHYK